MFIYLYVFAIFFPGIALYGFVVSFFNKCKDRLSACHAHIGNFSLAHSILEQKCAQLDTIKAVTYCNAIVDRSGLPRDPGAKHHWGEPFSIYTSPGGRKFHLQYGCCGATHVRHLYTLPTDELDEAKFCSKCRKNLHPNLIPFLRLYRECRYYLRKENTACTLLKHQITKCEKGLMRILYRRKLTSIKSDYKDMLSQRETMQDKLRIHFRKGYFALKGAEFYRVCYSKRPGAGTNPNPPFIVALIPVADSHPTDGKTYRILRFGFPGGGYILYGKDITIARGIECELLGISETEKSKHYLYLAKDSYNLLPPPSTQ